MSEPLISVTVPVYNTEKYLKHCLESIVNQSHKNLEIILVDDGSTDTSGEICDNYMLSDDRIKVIHQSNGGLSFARNVALDACTGDYYVLINSDDYITNDYCEKLLNAIITTGADVATCSAKGVPENSEFVSDTLITATETIRFLNKADYFTEIYLHHVDGNLYGCDVSCMYTKKIGEKIRYPEGLANAMDGWFSIDVWEQAESYAILESEKYFWRNNPTSITHTLTEPKITAYLTYNAHLTEVIQRLPAETANLLWQETVVAHFLPLRALAIIRDISHLKHAVIAPLSRYIRKNNSKIRKSDLSKRVKMECTFVTFLGFPLYRLAWQGYIKTFRKIFKKR